MKDKKPETLFRTFRSIVKAVGDEEGTIDVLIPMSTASVDRHGESIDPKGWKKSLKEFKKRPILLSSHNYGSLQNQIGELLDLQITEEGLLARPKYYINQGNPEADWGYFIASKNKAAFSVGFIPIKWEDSDGKDGKPSRTYTEQELIEMSQVTVPSNRDAIMGLQAKGVDDPVMSDIIAEVLEDKEFFKAEKGKINKLADSDESNKIADDIRKKVLDTPTFIEPIDPEKVKASMEKDEKLQKMIEQLKFYPEIKYIVTDDKDPDNENGKDQDFILMAERFCEKYLSYRKKFEDLEKKIADIELKAGAVLNAKNKSNLKQAQALIQSVLDSAGSEESLKDPGEGGEIVKKADTVITITETKKDDQLKDAATDQKTITIDDKVLKEAIAKALNYHLGINK